MKWKLGYLAGLLAAVAIVGYVWQHQQREGERKVLVFGEDSSNLAAYKTMREEFTASTGIQLEFEGATFEQSIEKADADFRNHTGNYDVVLQYNFSLARMALT